MSRGFNFLASGPIASATINNLVINFLILELGVQGLDIVYRPFPLPEQDVHYLSCDSKPVSLADLEPLSIDDEMCGIALGMADMIVINPKVTGKGAATRKLINNLLEVNPRWIAALLPESFDTSVYSFDLFGREKRFFLKLVMPFAFSKGSMKRSKKGAKYAWFVWRPENRTGSYSSPPMLRYVM